MHLNIISGCGHGGDFRNGMIRVGGAGKRHHQIVARLYTRGALRLFEPRVKHKLTPTICSRCDRTCKRASRSTARVVHVNRAVVTHLSLVDVHRTHNSCGCVHLTQLPTFFVDAVFPVSNVTSLGQIDLASGAFPNAFELLSTPLNKLRTLKGVEKRSPGRLYVEQLRVTLVAPEKRKTGRSGARRANGKGTAEL